MRNADLGINRRVAAQAKWTQHSSPTFCAPPLKTWQNTPGMGPSTSSAWTGATCRKSWQQVNLHIVSSRI